jgi:hypothetical protein
VLSEKKNSELSKLKIILLIDAVGEMFIAVPVNIKPCCLMHE